MLHLRQYSLFLHISLHLSLQFYIECSGYSIDTLELERPGKNLCVNSDVDCSNQIVTTVGTTEDDGLCLMKFYNKTSRECSDEGFIGQLGSEDQLGVVGLIPFPWFDGGIKFPALNVTFSDIQWKRLRMRFLRVGSETPQLCREFVVTSSVARTSVLSFDCLWSSATAGLDYRFQYVLTADDSSQYLHSYLVRMPRDNEVQEGARLLMVLDESQFPEVSARLLTPQTSVTADVTLYYRQQVDSAAVQLATWTVNVTGGMVVVGSYHTHSTVGFYHYNASLLTGEQTSTPTLQVKGVGVGVQALLATLVIAILFLGLLVLFLWKNKYRKISKVQEKPVSVLLVYESCYPSHVDNVYKFKQFLEDHCHVAPKLDLVEIPKSDSMNPWQWYYRAFETTDCVLVLASPDESTERGVHEDVVYTHLHDYAVKLLLAHSLHRQHKLRSACVKLPGCVWGSLLPEVSVVDKRFSLPEKLGKLLKFLHAPPLRNGSSLFLETLKQVRIAPKLLVTHPATPPPLPFDAKDFEPRAPLMVGSHTLRLDGETSSEEDNDDESADSLVPALKL